MIIDHIGFNVGDFARSRDFYAKALAPLGIEVVMGGDGWAMVGRNGKPEFWFGAHGPKAGPLHVAFAAKDRAQPGARLSRGGAGRERHGQRRPGLREQYHPNYYGAFVLDPDGHNVEAVCHSPE